mgnify:CR=1 FL=1
MIRTCFSYFDERKRFHAAQPIDFGRQLLQASGVEIKQASRHGEIERGPAKRVPNLTSVCESQRAIIVPAFCSDSVVHRRVALAIELVQVELVGTESVCEIFASDRAMQVRAAVFDSRRSRNRFAVGRGLQSTVGKNHGRTAISDLLAA